MVEEKIDFISEASHTVILEIEDKHGSEYEEKEISELPESLYAQYMNHLLDQARLCWEVIRNREAKQ